MRYVVLIHYYYYYYYYYLLLLEKMKLDCRAPEAGKLY